MRLSTARFCIIGTWFFLIVPISFLVFIQTSNNLYGNGLPSDKGLEWLSSVALPVTSILGFGGYDAYRSSRRGASASLPMFFVTLALLLFYVLAIMVVIGWGSVVEKDNNWDQVFHRASFVIGLYQGFFLFFLTKFMITNDSK